MPDATVVRIPSGPLRKLERPVPSELTVTVEPLIAPPTSTVAVAAAATFGPRMVEAEAAISTVPVADRVAPDPTTIEALVSEAPAAGKFETEAPARTWMEAALIVAPSRALAVPAPLAPAIVMLRERPPPESLARSATAPPVSPLPSWPVAVRMSARMRDPAPIVIVGAVRLTEPELPIE